MSLYADIIDEPESSLGSKTTSIKLLHDHLQTKRNAPKAAINKIPLGISITEYDRTVTKLVDELAPPPVIGNTKLDDQKGASLLGGDWDVAEEYDPRWPNDYEKLAKERTEKQVQEMASISKSNQVIATRSLGLDYDDDDDDYDTVMPTTSKPSAEPKASFGPPPSLLENVEKASGGSSLPVPGFEVSTVAAKIMAKMGYKEGQGLGKEEQGINKALEVEKTSKHQGKIILNTVEKNAPASTATKCPEMSITEMLKSPSRVVLLRNMVGPGEVDSELEPETKEECSKYGEVIRCVIREVQDYKTEEDAVRIFIEFVHVESAIKALIDLNGRYFGGRIVKASFYDPDRFEQRDL